MNAPHSAPQTRLADLVDQAIGVNPAKCYQCGKCSAGCPMAEEMPLRTHELMRMIQLDRRDRIFRDESIWLCLTCETCSERCPNGVDPAGAIDSLRGMAEDQERATSPRRIRTFHEAFLGQIKSQGRIHEVGLVAAYKLKSGALFDDVTTAPGMMVRGKLPLLSRKIEGIDHVRRIFAMCAAEEEAHK